MCVCFPPLTKCAAFRLISAVSTVSDYVFASIGTNLKYDAFNENGVLKYEM